MKRSGERAQRWCATEGARARNSQVKRTDRGRDSGKPHRGTEEAIPPGRIFQVSQQSAPYVGALCFFIDEPAAHSANV